MRRSRLGEHPDKTVCTSTHHHFLVIMHTPPPLHLPETFVQSWWWMERPTRTIAESETEESSHVSIKIKKLQSLTIPVQSHPGPQFIQFVFQSLDVSEKNAGNWGMVLSFSGSFPLFLQSSFHSGKVSHLHSLKSMLVWSQIVNAVKCYKKIKKIVLKTHKCKIEVDAEQQQPSSLAQSSLDPEV